MGNLSILADDNTSVPTALLFGSMDLHFLGCDAWRGTHPSTCKSNSIRTYLKGRIFFFCIFYDLITCLWNNHSSNMQSLWMLAFRDWLLTSCIKGKKVMRMDFFSCRSRIILCGATGNRLGTWGIQGGKQEGGGVWRHDQKLKFDHLKREKVIYPCIYFNVDEPVNNFGWSQLRYS